MNRKWIIEECTKEEALILSRHYLVFNPSIMDVSVQNLYLELADGLVPVRIKEVTND